ncbi:MAG: hypothetical protein A2147_02480 [Chloroflexi bacterium RBG_16_57_8]|nr:MAG: hypothetical protein A2147_02480 [Chloroflexi bacterium RBG_16_57_8]
MNSGVASCEEYIKRICIQFYANPTEGEVASAGCVFLDSIRRLLAVPRNEASGVLAALRRRGLRTGLVSNAAGYVADGWRDSPLAPLFDVAVFSCSVGLTKPDPEIYALASRRLEALPSQCLYIADGKYRELSGAEAVGMKAVQLRVPRETDNDDDRQRWSGPVISSLTDLLSLVA